MVTRASSVKFNLSSVLLLTKNVKRSYDSFSLSKKSCPSGDDCIGASSTKKCNTYFDKKCIQNYTFCKTRDRNRFGKLEV